MFCSASIYSTDLRWQELIEELVHREHCLMEPCKKAAPAQADCNWDLQAMTSLQASINLLWWQPVNSEPGRWFLKCCGCRMFGFRVILRRGQSPGAGDGIYKCSFPIWTVAVLHRLWKNQCERVAPVRMAYLTRREKSAAPVWAVSSLPRVLPASSIFPSKPLDLSLASDSEHTSEWSLSTVRAVWVVCLQQPCLGGWGNLLA